MRSPFKLSALFLTTAIALGISGQANALDVGENKSFTQMEQKLTQENQIEVARAKYILHPEDPSKAKVLCIKFTVNANGEGYILMSDNMDDSKATKEVVYGKLKNARAYDPRNVGVLPQGVSIQSNLGEFVRSAASEGRGVLFHGQSVKKMPDGSDVVVGFTTVMAKVTDVKNPSLNNTLAIFLTSPNDTTSIDKVVATELTYNLAPKVLAK